MLKGKMAKFAIAAVLALGICPAMAFAATEADGPLVATSADMQAAADESVEIAVTSNVKMFTPAEKSTVKKIDGVETLVFVYGKDSFSNAFVGTAAMAAEADESGIIAYDKDTQGFNIPLTHKENGQAFTVAFQSKSNGNWYNRQFTLDREKATLTIDPFTGIDSTVKYMYRLYNPNSYEHFYTSDAAERDDVIAAGWNYEGVGWAAPVNENGTPVYRVYNPNNGGDHHFTKNKDEFDNLVSLGWKDEGIAWYSDEGEDADEDMKAAAEGEEAEEAAGPVKVYREYNPNEIARNHNYTTDEAEHKHLVELGWQDEGTAWMATLAKDEANASQVDALIAAIQVQTRTETTDADCEAAKKAWDLLSDEQKALVEEADYFERETGDASKDDPLNADEIGEKEILVVSFGTSFNDSRAEDIGGIEAAIAAANPEWSVRRAFTAQIIINHIQARDGEKIDNMTQALDRAVASGVKELVIQPTHLMHGAEYDELVAATKKYKDKMTIKIAEPLLGEVGATAEDLNADKEAVAKAAVTAAVDESKYADLDAAEKDKTAFVFMGHGTGHKAAITYEQMQTQMTKLGYKNVFIGTVEGEPESTECQAVIEAVKAAGYDKVILRPLMVVAGDHANNDMADLDDEESWASQFTADKDIKKVECQIKGLGSIKAIQKLYVAHTAAAITPAD